MRILWFTNTASNASEEFNLKTYRGGWISALETSITRANYFSLGICFFYDGSSLKKVVKGDVTYYGIPSRSGNSLQRILSRHFAVLKDQNPRFFDDVIDEFKPDIIHVFGTESGFGKILLNRKEKIVFNFQGLLNPIVAVYFPPEMKKSDIINGSGPISLLRGVTFLHSYKILKKMAKREKATLQHYKYFIGRTSWDRNYLMLLNSDARYFHCDEMLRSEFFDKVWESPSNINANTEITIGTTISHSPYKGLDLVYKVINLMSNYKIRWKIFGISETDVLNHICRKKYGTEENRQSIEFFGQIKPSELIKHLSTCHFFVHPSYIDNSPNSVCEAMLMGLPVLASSIGGISSLVKHDKTGFLFNPYDSYDLAGQLVNLIQDYERAKNVGLNARQVALKRHSSEIITSEIAQIYNSVLGE